MIGGLPEEALALEQEQGGLPQQQPAPQQMAPQGGALAPPEATQQGGNAGYNGVIEAFGRQIEVINGVAVWDQEKYFVSDDGMMVIDEQDMIVGRIENGQFIEADDAYIEELRAQGMVEEGA
tara:strand:- start:826 stop:1191 length:366 start_codon:yes stop_codon:yes gene_type:complete